MKYLTPDEVTDLCRQALRQVEERLVSAEINAVLAPHDSTRTAAVADIRASMKALESYRDGVIASMKSGG